MKKGKEQMRRSFTLIELIVVIIIVGILAAMGISQYSKMVEKSRGAEARMILGTITKFAYEYWITNGTIAPITNADVNIGTTSDSIPSTCRSSYYFSYAIGASGSNRISATAYRCTTGGKTPQSTCSAGSDCDLCLWVYMDGSGSNVWDNCYGGKSNY
ncbi:prepilin-type N-terminal cleavage/methylation domain-containing protein [bacterium]|nr:MAG: prepilin-type N-terminal cleavage/methylation domain-containing protein [bacterium]